MPYGRSVLAKTGEPTSVIAGPLSSAQFKPGGITIDWTTVVAAPADILLNDGNVIKAGMKGLEYGTIMCQITASGLYGPYLASATDGRQNIARGSSYILVQSNLQFSPLGITTHNTDSPAVCEGGLLWKKRIATFKPNIADNNQAVPTVAAFESAFPLVRYAIQ